MRRGHHKPHAPPPNPYAGPTTCLRCDARFESWDRRQNRLCLHCREASEEEPSPEPSYTIKRAKRRFLTADDADGG